jgi:hypothetical protein
VAGVARERYVEGGMGCAVEVVLVRLGELEVAMGKHRMGSPDWRVLRVQLGECAEVLGRLSAERRRLGVERGARVC